MIISYSFLIDIHAHTKKIAIYRNEQDKKNNVEINLYKTKNSYQPLHNRDNSVFKLE